MRFSPDKRFESIREASEFIIGQYAGQAPERLWHETTSGPAVPNDAPLYLFRGECGAFEDTKAAIYRRRTFQIQSGGKISRQDRQVLVDLITQLARRFTDKDYSVDGHHSIGLLQHYGLPTWMIDFTMDVETAFAFAASGDSAIGRVAVFPAQSLCESGGLVNLTEHRWAERPRRQLAFGLIMPDMTDLKSAAVRSRQNIR